MKKFLLIILISLAGAVSYSQEINDRDFTYPLQPGDSNWEKMNSVEERIASLQIPEATLTNIPTERLLEICLDFPYLLDVLFCDNYQEGIEALRNEFNGFNELLNRKDLGKCALTKYQSFPSELNKIQKKTEVEKGKFSFQSLVLELILAQDYVFDSLNSDEENEFFDLTIQNKALKSTHADIFGSLNTDTSNLLYSRKALSDSSTIFKDATRSSDDYMLINSVETPNGSTVQDTGILISSDNLYTSSQLAAMRKELSENYNGAILIDNPTREYNCHAYAWNVSEGGNRVWIGLYSNTAEDVYWEDESYVEVSETSATKVSYHESGNHSAIRLSSDWYQSKWGQGPLVKHHPNDVPSIYNPSMTKKYYKRNLPNMWITGQTYICSFAEYSVENLPKGATVNWTYTPVYSTIVPTIQKNSPSINSCTINNTYSQIFEGYLKAEVIISGKVQITLSKLIKGDSDNFIGFYWQPSNDGSWVPDMSISLDEPNIAIPPYDVIIESDNFRGKRVTSTSLGYTSLLQTSASNRISFEMPNLPSGELLTIRVDGSDCSSPITFTFESQSYAKSLNDKVLMINPIDANHFSISPDWPTITDMSADSTKRSVLTATEIPTWHLEVYNTTQNQMILDYSVEGSCYTLDLSTFNPGIYIVCAIIGDKKYAGKVCKH